MEERRSAAWEAHKGKIIGLVGGLAVGLFMLRYGFWRTLLVIGFVSAGMWLGAVVDREGWPGVADRLVNVWERGRRR